MVPRDAESQLQPISAMDEGRDRRHEPLQEGIAASQLRAKQKSLLPIADAISMALAPRRNATLVTTDCGIRDAKEKGKVHQFTIEP